MGFWTDSSFEPKQNFKFKVKFIVSDNDNDLYIPYYYATEADKPSFEIAQKTYKYINVQEKYPANIVWNDISLSFIDTVDNRVLAFLTSMLNLRELDLKNPSFNKNHTSFSKNRLHVKAIEIHQLSNQSNNFTEENSVEKWILINPWITKVQQDKLSYESQDLNKIVLNLTYDWAYLSFEDSSGQEAAPPKIKNNEKQVKRRLEENVPSEQIQQNIEQNVIIKRSDEQGMTTEEALFQPFSKKDGWEQNKNLPDSKIGAEVGNVATVPGLGFGGVSYNVDEANPLD